MASSNKSDSLFWPKCTCNRRCDLDEDTSDDEDEYYDDDDSSYIDDEESENESVKIVLISVYNNSFLNNSVMICDAEEIELYRSKYSQLTNKSVAKIKNIFGEIKVQVPLLGTVSLKIFIEKLNKGLNQRKKQLKRPDSSMQLQNSNNNSSTKSGSTNIEKSLSTAQLEKGKENLTVNTKSNEKNINTKLLGVKTNAEPQNKDKKTNSTINLENKSDINNKELQTVNNTHKNTECKINITAKSNELDKGSKNKILVNNTKSSVNEAQKNNSTLANNIDSINKDQKSNLVINSPLKVNLENKKESKSSDKNENKFNATNDSKNLTSDKNTKSSVCQAQNKNSSLTSRINVQKTNSENTTATKINLENKDKEKSNTTNQNSTPKKSNIINKNENVHLINSISKAANTPEKGLKINASKQSNPNEIKNLVNEPKISSTANKSEKEDLVNTPSKKNNKNKQNNLNGNNKDASSSTKQTLAEFKKPFDKPTLNSSGINTVKISNKSSTAQVVSGNTENNVCVEIIDKASQTKLKKQKRKIKKIEINKRDSSNCSSRDTTDNSSHHSSPDRIRENVNKNNKSILTEKFRSTKKQEGKKVKNADKNNTEIMYIDTEESEDQSESIITNDDELDFLTDNENLPVFLAKIKEKSKIREKSKIKEKNNKVKTGASAKLNLNSKETKDLVKDNNKQEFIINSKKRVKVSNPIIDQKNILYSDTCGENAYRMILENNFMQALEYLVDAIAYNYIDQRHYLNRCYCYLSMKKYALALADAEYIIKISNNIGFLFLANIRAAQALYRLQNYDEAETYLKEAICLNPTSVYLSRELILIQVARIVSMGFSEKDAILALEKYSSVESAVNYLIGSNANKLNNSLKEDEIYLDNCDELVYSSDEDESSNAEIVNRILNYKPGTVKFQHIISKPVNAHLLVCDNGNNTMKEKKVVQNERVNSEKAKAIWVGNLANSITEAMLRKKFKEFGKIVSIYRPLNEAYAFINFEKAEDVTNVLTNTPCHELAGIKLLVRSGIRQK